MNLEEIRSGILEESSISDIVGERMFYRNPLQEQTEAYIVFQRLGKDRDMVRETNRLQFVCFSQDMAELETLSNALITYLEGRNIIGDDTYFKIYFIAQADIGERLETGFYANILNFGFRATT